MGEKLTRLSDDVKRIAESCKNKHFVSAVVSCGLATGGAALGVDAFSKGQEALTVVGLGLSVCAVGKAIDEFKEIFKKSRESSLKEAEKNPVNEIEAKS